MRSRFPKRAVLLGSLAVLLISILIGTAVTVRFLREYFPKMTQAVTEFAPNQPHVFTPDDPRFTMSLAAIVPEAGASAPAAEVAISDARGEVLPTRSADRWSSIMGRHYRYFANFGPAEGELTIVVAANPTERFTVFYHPETVLNTGIEHALPGWLSAAGLFFAGTIGLLWALVAGGSGSHQQPEPI